MRKKCIGTIHPLKQTWVNDIHNVSSIFTNLKKHTINHGSSNTIFQSCFQFLGRLRQLVRRDQEILCRFRKLYLIRRFEHLKWQSKQELQSFLIILTSSRIRQSHCKCTGFITPDTDTPYGPATSFSSSTASRTSCLNIINIIINNEQYIDWCTGRFVFSSKFTPKIIKV